MKQRKRRRQKKSLNVKKKEEGKRTWINVSSNSANNLYIPPRCNYLSLSFLAAAITSKGLSHSNPALFFLLATIRSSCILLSTLKCQCHGRHFSLLISRALSIFLLDYLFFKPGTGRPGVNAFFLVPVNDQLNVTRIDTILIFFLPILGIIRGSHLVLSGVLVRFYIIAYPPSTPAGALLIGS